MPDEFDSYFQHSLLETVSSERMPSDICEMIQDDHKTGVIKNERFRALLYGFNRVLFVWLCRFNRMDFLSDRTHWRASFRISTRKKFINLFRNRTRRTDKIWPYVFGTVYVACVTTILINLYFQYTYDANIAKLNKIKSYLQDGGGDVAQKLAHLNVTNLQLKFQSRASSARQTLEWMGAAHIDWAFVYQSICLTYIISSLNLYVVVPLSHVVNGWTLFTPLLILSPKRENQLRSELVLEQVRNFSAISFSYVKRKMDQIAHDFNDVVRQQSNKMEPSKQQHSTWTSGRVLSVLGRRLAINHQMTVRQLKKIAIEGRLKPLNRSPACRDKLVKICLVALAVEILYMEASIQGRHRTLRKFYVPKPNQEPSSWKENFSSFFFVLLIHFHGVSALFLGLILISTWFDQKEAARRLRMLILHTTRINQSRFCQLMTTTKTRLLSYSLTPSTLVMTRAGACRRASVGQLKSLQYKFATNELCQQMDRDLMTIVIQTRLLTRSFEMIKRPLSVLCFSAIFYACSMLVMFRLNSPYFHPELKPFSMSVAVSCIIVTFLYLIPLSLLHQQCIATYRELWSLAAQVSYFETVPQINQFLEIELSVAAFSLRRELSDSRHRMDQFACRVMAMPITNQNLIRLGFWAFILIISFTSNINLFGDGISAFANDPFGLFDFT